MKEELLRSLRINFFKKKKKGEKPGCEAHAVNIFCSSWTAYRYSPLCMAFISFVSSSEGKSCSKNKLALMLYCTGRMILFCSPLQIWELTTWTTTRNRITYSGGDFKINRQASPSPQYVGRLVIIFN